MEHARLAEFAQLERALGYTFADRGLLALALTHRSFGSPHNERLEFIGDSVLNCVIALALFERFPDLPEGELSRLRANLVRQEGLHRVALGLDLGNFLRLGEGELRSGGKGRASILADALEAVFGAICRDAGFDAAAEVIRRLYARALAALVPGQAAKDPKTRLQEWLQGRHKPLPTYQLRETAGAAHDQRFHVVCRIDEPALSTAGQGSSRRLAEQDAAAQALAILEESCA